MLFWRNRHEIRDEELNAFVDGELGEPARLRVERHIDSCTSCSETVAELQAVSRAMSDLPAVQAPRSFALREADVHPAPASSATGLFGSVTPLLSGVAAIAIVAFVVLVGVDITEQTTSDFGDTASRTMSLEQDELASAAPGVVDAADPDGNGSIDRFEFYAGYGDTAIEDGVPAQGTGTPPDGEGISDSDPDLPAVGDPEEPLAFESGVLPEELEQDPLSGGLDQGFSGDSTALELADDGDSTGLRVAESVAAAVAVAATGSVLLIWRRNRTTAG